MKLRAVRVRAFKCIEDSEEFSVPDVTCLVGKNESGKTALLQAINKLNPVLPSDSTFTPLEYPRRRYTPNTPLPVDPPALWTRWTLDADDVTQLEQQFGKGLLHKLDVVVTKSYDNVARAHVELHEKAVVDRLVAEANLSEQDVVDLGGAHETVDSLRAAVGKVAAPTERHAALKARLEAALSGGPHAAVGAAILGLLPQSVYFNQYYTLPGQVAVEDYLARKQSGQLRPGEQVFEALLELAGTTPGQIRQLNKFEDLNAALRGVSNNISEQVFEYWTQNRYLDAVLRMDAAQPGDQPPFNTGTVFRTRIENRRHRVDTSFDDRSSGFVWFFSFLIWFSQLKHRLGKRLIVLLDEPGLTLHARAQGDLLRYIRERLRPEYQVLYTTHSPFMIDPDNLLAARTVEDVEKDGKVLGTKVGDQVLSRDPDTISPLQKALDYEITQTLFIGRNTLLVEGASDLVYLQWFSHQLVKARRESLDYRWAICPAGGADRIPGFVALFSGNNLNIVALVDYASGGKQKVERAAKLLGAHRLLRADTYAEQKEADIEDMLGRDFYAGLVNTAFGLTASQQIDPTTIGTSGSRLLPDVENHMRLARAGLPEFDHYFPAKFLFEHEDVGIGLPGYSDALDRFERFFKDLNRVIA
ncbi:MAG: ATP-dependent nuclease [Gemmatimonadaceae bacterium]